MNPTQAEKKLFFVHVEAYVPVMASTCEEACEILTSRVDLPHHVQLFGPVSDIERLQAEPRPLDWDSKPIGSDLTVHQILLGKHPRWRRVSQTSFEREDGMTVMLAPPKSVSRGLWGVHFRSNMRFKGQRAIALHLFTDNVFDLAIRRVWEISPKPWWKFFQAASEAMSFLDENWQNTDSIPLYFDDGRSLWTIAFWRSIENQGLDLMSYLQQVVQVGSNEYVLEKVGGMLTEVRAFLSPKLFSQTDEALWQQAAASASTPGAKGMYLLPDCHLGYQLPVGGVLVTEDVILQAGSGYDISCGVVMLKVPGLTAEDVSSWEKRRWWVEAVERRIATGKGQGRKATLKSKVNIQDVLHYGVRPMGVSSDMCERQYIPIPDDLDFRAIERAYGLAKPQLGSVGGGNHFVELQVDRDDGSVWAMIHCGSRGFGWQTANHFFHEGAALRGLPKSRKEESWLRADEELGKLYWAWHNAAANYAVANRWTIVDGVQDALEEVFKVRGEPFFEISHNLVQEEVLVLPDGSTSTGFVHRKGSTRAFPAGHPSLVGTGWEDTGHPCLIPGSMLDGAAILFPLEGAYRSGCSVNHGSGRILSRSKAKSELSAIHDDIDEEMRNISRAFGPDGVRILGVVGNTERTPLDECAHVYKNLDDVLRVLEDEGIAKVVRRLFPIANIKGAD